MSRATAGEVEGLERALASRWPGAHAVAQPSARVGLVHALEALDVPRGAEVIVSAYNYPPLLERFRRAGYVPVPVDVAPRSTSPTAQTIAAAVGPRTAAIVATHAFGRPAPVRDYRRVADRHGLALIEDAAQALGADVGVASDAAVFSFGPTKPLAAWGGGALLTRSERLAARLRGTPTPPPTRWRWARGLAFELASRHGGALGRLDVDWDRWATESEGQLRQRRWQDAALDPACAALVRARLVDLPGITRERRQAHRRQAARLRAEGLDVLRDPAGGIGFGALVWSERPRALLRSLRRRGIDAARGELRAIGSAPGARALERAIVRVPVE